MTATIFSTSGLLPGCDQDRVSPGVPGRHSQARSSHLRHPGHRVSIAAYGGHKSQIRDYSTCKPSSAVAISFDKNPDGIFRLSAKSAVWVF